MGRNDYGIFFTYNNTVIRLPINPAELPEDLEANNSEYNVLGIGPITIPRTPKQKEVTISSYFPAAVTAAVLTGGRFQPPEFYIEFFRAALNEKRILTYTPVRYTENGEAFAANDHGWQCLVMAFNLKEKGGETGDFYYSLTIREYRDYSPQVLTVKETSEEIVVSTTPTRDVPRGEIVVGDSVIANGKFYLSSYGDEPHGLANNRNCKVTRIVTEAGRAYPIHIASENGGALGWIAKDAVRKA